MAKIFETRKKFQSPNMRAINELELRRLIAERARARTAGLKQGAWKAPSEVERVLYGEIPVVSPLLLTYKHAGLKGVLKSTALILFGQVPVFGDLASALARRHGFGQGVVVDLPNKEYRQLIKIVGAKEGARLLNPLISFSRWRSERVSQPEVQHVQVSPEVLQHVKREEILNILKQGKAYHPKEVMPIRRLPPEVRAAVYKKLFKPYGVLKR